MAASVKRPSSPVEPERKLVKFLHTKRDRTHLRERFPLRYALYCAGIAPFDTTSVETYKANRLDDMRCPRPMVYMYRPPNPKLAAISAFVVFSSLGALGFDIAPQWLLFALLCIGIGLFFRATLLAKKQITVIPGMARPDAEWLTCTIEDYNPDRLPEKVRDTHKEIAMRCPQAEPVVHFLYEDPFLEMRLGGESYYVEFWNEPGFEDGY